MALNNNALLTEAELELILGKSLATDYAEMLINFASDVIEKYCNRVFRQVEYTDEKYDGRGYKILYVKNPPIDDGTAVAVKDWNTNDNSLLYTYTEHTEFIVFHVEGYIYLRSGFKTGKQNYRISYKGGFENIPWDLKVACAELGGFLDSNKGVAGVKSEKIGDYAISYGSSFGITIGGLAVPPEALSKLANYRLINIQGEVPKNVFI
jgi:hypothetical protein